MENSTAKQIQSQIDRGDVFIFKDKGVMDVTLAFQSLQEGEKMYGVDYGLIDIYGVDKANKIKMIADFVLSFFAKNNIHHGFVGFSKPEELKEYEKTAYNDIKKCENILERIENGEKIIKL